MIPQYLKQDVLVHCEPVLSNEDLPDAAWWVALEEKCSVFMDSHKLSGSVKQSASQVAVWYNEDETL